MTFIFHSSATDEFESNPRNLRP